MPLPILPVLADDGALHTEVDVVRCILGDFKQPVLDMQYRILQPEIEGGALPGDQVPNRLALDHHYRQPELTQLGEPARMCRPWDSSISTTKRTG